MSSPVYALYARPTDIKLTLKVTDTDDDARFLRACQWASRQIDRITKRHFYPKVETVLYDAPRSGSELMFNRDLISLTTLLNGNDVEIASDEYFLYPDSGPPYSWLELDTSQGVAWQYAATRQRALSLTGIWGWDEITEASGATVSSNYSADGTSLTPSAVSTFAVGDLLKIGDDYLYVTTVGESALTIKPGVNGATSADHASGTAIYFVLVPDDLREIANRLAEWRHKQHAGIFESTAHRALGTITIPAAVPPDIKADLVMWTR